VQDANPSREEAILLEGRDATRLDGALAAAWRAFIGGPIHRMGRRYALEPGADAWS